MSEFFDLLKLMQNSIIDRNTEMQHSSTKSHLQGYDSLERSHQISSETTLHNGDEALHSLSDKLQSIDLLEKTKAGTSTYDTSDVSNVNSVDIKGSTVRCKRPCIDVNKVYKQDSDGDTLLHTAIIILQLDLAHYFIDMTPHFTWLNIRNHLSQTPLHLAVLVQDVALVRRLVVAGADPESTDKDGNMAIHIACRDNQINIVRALFEPVRYEEQDRNNYDIPFRKIPHNLEAKNYDGFTCLHIAALLDHAEIFETLIEYGANVNSKAEKSGRSVLHEAAWSGNLNLVKFLISLGDRCNINSRTYDGYTAFDLARSRGHWNIVLELATTGARYEEEEEVE